MLADANDWLNEMVAPHLQRTVTYRRGGVSAEVAATLGSSVLMLGSDGVTRIERTERDYLIAAELLEGFGQPAKGDKIDDDNDGDTLVYEVRAPDNEPVWRWSDPYRKVYRIHVKLVG